MNLFLLQMAGLPGSGKTSLARAIGRETGAAVIDKDEIMAGAQRFGIEASKTGALAYEIGYGLARSILANGLSVVLDSPANFVAIRETGARIACETGARYYIIECSVPRDVAEDRIRCRQPVQALHPVTLAGLDLDFERPGTAPLAEPRLTMETTRPLDECLRYALEYIGR